MGTRLPKDGSADGLSSLTFSPRSSPRKARKSALLTALFVRRQRWSLTWTGRLLLWAFVVALCVILVRGLYTFLAITRPVGGQFLVVEGWVPASALREVAAQFSKGGYKMIIVAGGLNEDCGAGELRGRYARDKLIKFGVPNDLVVTAPTDEVQRDRTFHAALGVKRWLREQGLRTTSVDVVTLGPHARRSRLLYENALGNEVQVGVIAGEDQGFDPNHWWRSSAGVRAVVGEAIAYLYSTIFVFAL